ncbi:MULTISPECIES: hypothetical protein [unclassified Burkholderia]|uniref:hypothetical protein n=1 Tax=unclassified Burkholderia TaxID=2613784 RepID=UPI000F5B4735|nr:MULTISPECIES: hypothetical protein [unclassified Burkholderia]RQS22450.1 hypothetical protein DIE05_29965 [Burkholderia sp. Bp8995]RQS39240.1 hypothetical protein DIE00_34120 [Burkholderia sp. Bp8989]
MPATTQSTARDFFLSTVKPTVDEFLGDTLDVRRGRLAAIVLHHMADHAAIDGYSGKEMQKRVRALHKDLIDVCPDFALICDIADASKHARLHVREDKPRQVSTAEQITMLPGLFHAPFGEGVFREASCVIVRLESGMIRPLETPVRLVLRMWEEILFPGPIQLAKPGTPL